MLDVRKDAHTRCIASHCITSTALRAQEGGIVKSFVINRHGSLVLPSNCFPELDFSVLQTLEQFSAVVKRDFDAKAPTGTNLRERSETQAYNSRYELLRDLGLHLFWVNRLLDHDVREATNGLAARPEETRRCLHAHRHALAGRRAQDRGGLGRVQPAAGYPILAQ
jgi:hypothetical protein